MILTKTTKYSRLSSFADDTRLKKTIKNIFYNFKLQHNHDLNNVYKWSNNKSMKLNGKKFEQLHYGNKFSLKRRTSILQMIKTDSKEI